MRSHSHSVRTVRPAIRPDDHDADASATVLGISAPPVSDAHADDE
ncbi:hypothetical protein [Natrinema gelatinilyticum]|nr:hypothetical protein [Natrinema gelatinilyticum]